MSRPGADRHDAGTDWLGHLPAHWTLQPIGTLAAVRTSTVDKKSHDGETPVRLCNYTDVYYGDRLDPSVDFMHATASRDQIAQFTPRAGDVPVTKDSETADDIGISAFIERDMPGVVYGYHLAIYRPGDYWTGRFIKYLFDSAPIKASLETRTLGVTRVGLSQNTLNYMRVPVPPAAERQRIADFLDRETAEIDAFIADQERLIELLAERRRAMIASALTEVSEATETRLKFVASIALGKMLQPAGDENEEDTHPYLRAANVQPDGVLDLANVKRMRFTRDEIRRLTLRQGDVVIVEGGVGGYGRAAYLDTDLPGIGFQNSIIRLRPHDSDGRFLTYALLDLRARGYIEMAASVTSMPHYTAEKVAETPIRLPPAAEQIRVADRLDHATAEIAAAVADAREAIRLSKERRAALITAAVTGRIDLRAS